MSGGMYKEIIAKMCTVFKAGVCKMYGQVSQGVQLWMRLLQLGVPLVSGEKHRTHRQCEQHRDVTGSIERKSSKIKGPS